MHAKIRRGQIITNFGPGAMINLEQGSFIAMGIDSWPNSGREDLIYEDRLQNKLKVKYFRQPPEGNVFPKGLPYRRFPRWLFCPKCRLLKHYEKWIENDTRRYPTAPYCGTCRKALVPMGFIVACRKGHLDEFPWVYWVHKGKDPCCSDPTFEYDTSLAGAGLSGIRIKCTQCKQMRSMQGVFTPGVFKEKKCTGGIPWSKDNGHEDCAEDMVTLQRGGSNVYFPRIVSSITIPPYTNELFDSIKGTNTWYVLSTVDTSNMNSAFKDEIYSQISKEINRKFEDVKACIEGIQSLSENKDTQTEEGFRFDEYRAFHGNYDATVHDKKDFEVVRGEKVSEYSKFGIDDIFLVKTLREIRALFGFTRLRPFDIDAELAGDEETKEVPELVLLTDKPGRPASWKPAIEVRGEGIFITLDPRRIEEWANNKEVLLRLNLINKNYAESCHRRKVKFKPVSAKYILLHTYSHLLIRQLSFEAGYSSASLRERLYCESLDKENEMQGILIYTAAGDADGTLGGLVRQAKPERFLQLLSSMVEFSRWCSNDPLCIESTGQGFESLNLAACYACALMPETSCEEYNKFLDRALLVGTPENPSIGFINQAN